MCTVFFNIFFTLTRNVQLIGALLIAMIVILILLIILLTNPEVKEELNGM